MRLLKWIGNELQKLWHWLFNKRSELESLDYKDAYMASIVLDIHQSRSHKSFVSLPLHELSQIHPLDRENSIKATQERVAVLQKHKAAMLEQKHMSRDILAEYLPSVTYIKVIQAKPGLYYAFEGNGRIAAMQAVFTQEDAITVEVEQYHLKRPRRILRHIRRLRKLNHVEETLQ